MLALTALVLLSVSKNHAEIGAFDPAFEGQLWGMRHELSTDGFPSGLTFVDSTLYVGDDTGNVAAFGPDGAEIPLPDADWGPDATIDPFSPLFGFIPNQLSNVPVAIVDGASTVETTAILISDLSINRVLAFDLQGRYLFTMQLDWPGISYRGDVSYHENSVAIINDMSMAPDSRFVFSPALNTLRLEGSFAAAWAADFGRYPGALLAYHAQPFTFDSGEGFFEANPHAVLTDNGTVIEPFGVTFDSQSNLYFVDTITERLRAYAPDFSPLFVFGTPAPGGTAEFYQPFGLSFWPDDQGGRLFIADAVNNRVVAYRPNLSSSTLDYLFSIEGFTIDGLDNAQPYAITIEPATGRLATSDSSGVGPRSWILQPRNLAAFDVKVLDSGGTPVEAVCSGAAYSVQFGLTVPEGWPAVTGVLPELIVDGAVISPPTATAIDLSAGQASISTYQLVAPGDETNPFVGEIALIASATTATPADLLPRRGSFIVRNCAGDSPPTVTVTATSEEPQVSGWTVHTGAPFEMQLTAVDEVEVRQIEYRLEGTNDIGLPYPPVANPNPGSTTQVIGITLTELGLTTVWFRARDNDFADSAWQRLDVWLVPVDNRNNVEGDSVSFSVRGPIDGGQTYSTGPLPDGIAFDPNTARFSGTLSFTSHGAYPIVVTESIGVESSSYSFVWRVTDVNAVPGVIDDAAVTLEDSAVSISVLANDADADLDAMTVTAVTQPAGSEGTVTISDGQTVRFTPAADFSGVGIFTYTAHDGHNGSATGVVTVTVTAVNDGPHFVAGNNQSVLEDAPLQAVTNWATAIGAGPSNESGQQVSFVLANSNPSLFASGPAIAPSGTLTYQPAPNQSGTAIVTVRLTDDGGTANGGVDTSAPQTFTITVEPVNDAPLAAADSYTVIESRTLKVPAPGVLANDTDIDSSTLIAGATSAPPGSLLLGPDGSFTYTPPQAFVGAVTFTYTASDGNAVSSATVTIVVSPANLPPVCTAASVTPSAIWPANHKPIDVTIGGVTDPEGAAVSIRFDSIIQDEPTDSEGQGNTLQDGGIEANGTRAWVRAERAASKKVPGDGRVYLIGFTATDAGGLTCAGTVRIDIPHDQRGARAVLSPGRWNSVTGRKLP